MASSYLDLYSKTTYDATPAIWGGPRATTTNQRVVHDKYNNIYYGTQTQDELTKGLQSKIDSLTARLKSGKETRYDGTPSIWGGPRAFTYTHTAKDTAQFNASLKSSQNYLNHIQGGGYKQEGKDFFKSYDAYTGDWNNVFKRRKSNADRTEANRLQEIQNEKTRVRNKKIEGENQVKAGQALKQQDTQIATGSKAKAKSLNPRLEINTGVSAQADKLAKSLNTGLSV